MYGFKLGIKSGWIYLPKQHWSFKVEKILIRDLLVCYVKVINFKAEGAVCTFGVPTKDILNLI